MFCLQGQLLSRITAEDVAHVVRLVSTGRLTVGQTTYTALLLRPVGRHLDAQTSISRIAQVRPGLQSAMCLMVVCACNCSYIFGLHMWRSVLQAATKHAELVCA